MEILLQILFDYFFIIRKTHSLIRTIIVLMIFLICH